ncbi:MAG: hypothetical protein ACKOEM_08730 [Planctomycetia bacterium]
MSIAARPVQLTGASAASAVEAHYTFVVHDRLSDPTYVVLAAGDPPAVTVRPKGTHEQAREHTDERDDQKPFSERRGPEFFYAASQRCKMTIASLRQLNQKRQLITGLSE